MTKAKIKQMIIERILRGESNGLTSREIFNQMDPSDQGAFPGGVNGVAKELHYLCSKGVLDRGTDAQGPNKWILCQPAIAKPVCQTQEASSTLNDELAQALIDDAKCLLLNPDNAIDASFIAIITMLRAAQALPEPIKIDRKYLKIDTLKKIAAIMSDDINIVLNDISRDLANLEEINV